MVEMVELDFDGEKKEVKEVMMMVMLEVEAVVMKVVL